MRNVDIDISVTTAQSLRRRSCRSVIISPVTCEVRAVNTFYLRQFEV